MKFYFLWINIYLNVFKLQIFPVNLKKLGFYLTLNFIGGVLEHDEILSIDGEEFSGNNFNEALEKFESIMENKATVW